MSVSHFDDVLRSRRLARETRHGGFSRRCFVRRLREDEHARGVTHGGCRARAKHVHRAARGRPAFPLVVLAEKNTTVMRIRRGGRGSVRVRGRGSIRVRVRRFGRGDVGETVRRDDRGGVGRGVGIDAGNARRIGRVGRVVVVVSVVVVVVVVVVALRTDARTSGASAEDCARSRAASASAAAAYRSASARALAYSSERRRAVSRAAATAAFARAIGSSPRAGSPEAVDDDCVVGGKSARCAPTLDAADAGSTARGDDGDAPRDDALARSSGDAPIARARGVPRRARRGAFKMSRATTSAVSPARRSALDRQVLPVQFRAPSPSPGSTPPRRVARLGRGAEQRRPHDVRAVRHPHSRRRDVQRRRQERHHHPLLGALQAPATVHRERPALAHLRPLSLVAPASVQRHAIHPGENPETSGRAQRRRRDVRLIDGKRCARKGTAGTGQGRACEKDEGNLARRRGVGEARAGKQGTGSAYRRRRRIPQPRRSSWATRPSLCPTRAWTVARRALPVERETSSL